MGMTAIDDADPKREDIMTLLNTFKVHTGTLQCRSRHYINDFNVLKKLIESLQKKNSF